MHQEVHDRIGLDGPGCRIGAVPGYIPPSMPAPLCAEVLLPVYSRHHSAQRCCLPVYTGLLCAEVLPPRVHPGYSA